MLWSTFWKGGQEAPLAAEGFAEDICFGAVEFPPHAVHADEHCGLRRLDVGDVAEVGPPFPSEQEAAHKGTAPSRRLAGLLKQLMPDARPPG